MHLATVIKHPNLSIYPQFHTHWKPAYNKLVLPRAISQPVCTEEDCKQITVFWTRLSPPRDLDIAKWAPNHFVPCIHTKRYQSPGTLSAIKLPSNKLRPKKQLSLPTLLKQHGPAGNQYVNGTGSNTTSATRGWTTVNSKHSKRKTQKLNPNPHESRAISKFANSGDTDNTTSTSTSFHTSATKLQNPNLATTKIFTDCKPQSGKNSHGEVPAIQEISILTKAPAEECPTF